MKLAILIPCYGNPEAMFMQCLLNMVNHFSNAKVTDDNGEPIEIEWDVFIVASSMLTESRHKLIAEALAWGADYALCLDADHTFPPDAFLRLWAHNKPIVGCNYSRRVNPTAPTAAACGDEDGLLYTTKDKADIGLVEQCAHLGFGVLLINLKVLDVLQAHVESKGEESFLPLFLFEPTENKVGMVGEDVYFFRKLKEAGIVPWVDHGLSWEVGHITKTVFTNQHAVAHKSEWEARQKAKREEYEKKIELLEA